MYSHISRTGHQARSVGPTLDILYHHLTSHTYILVAQANQGFSKYVSS